MVAIVKMKSSSYKSYIAFVFAIMVTICLLFTNSDTDEMPKDHEPIVILLQMMFIFSTSLMLSLIIVCFTEKCSNCMCNVETKSLSNIVKKFTARSYLVMIPTIIAGLVSGGILIFLNASWNIVNTLIGIFVIATCLLAQEPTSIEISTMWEDNNINVGYGLASQYFFGYLKLLMSGDQDWEHRIKKYSSEQGVPIFGKLILLLPKSSNIRNTLTEVDSRIIHAQSLIPKIIYLSGIRREYRSTVWKIDEGIRFVAEYPPPLATIQDMCCVGIGHHLSNDAKREQLIIFSNHLQELVKNDPYCSNNCIIIPYDDTSEMALSEIIDQYISNDELEKARAAS